MEHQEPSASSQALALIADYSDSDQDEGGHVTPTGSASCSSVGVCESRSVTVAATDQHTVASSSEKSVFNSANTCDPRPSIAVDPCPPCDPNLADVPEQSDTGYQCIRTVSNDSVHDTTTKASDSQTSSESLQGGAAMITLAQTRSDVSTELSTTAPLCDITASLSDDCQGAGVAPPAVTVSLAGVAPKETQSVTAHSLPVSDECQRPSDIDRTPAGAAGRTAVISTSVAVSSREAPPEGVQNKTATVDGGGVDVEMSDGACVAADDDAITAAAAADDAIAAVDDADDCDSANAAADSGAATVDGGAAFDVEMSGEACVVAADDDVGDSGGVTAADDDEGDRGDGGVDDCHAATVTAGAVTAAATADDTVTAGAVTAAATADDTVTAVVTAAATADDTGAADECDSDCRSIVSISLDNGSQSSDSSDPSSVLVSDSDSDADSVMVGSARNCGTGGGAGRCGPLTRGELTPAELPAIEHLAISVATEQCCLVGHVTATVDTLVLVESANTGATSCNSSSSNNNNSADTPALDIDSLLFLEHGRRPLGRVYDVIGPVSSPVYCVRFNSPNEISALGEAVAVGAAVFFVPGSPLYTHYVFAQALRAVTGSDASWWDCNEPPDDQLDFSDDEQERLWKQKRRLSAKRGAVDPQAAAAAADSAAGATRQQRQKQPRPAAHAERRNAVRVPPPRIRRQPNNPFLATASSSSSGACHSPAAFHSAVWSPAFSPHSSSVYANRVQYNANAAYSSTPLAPPAMGAPPFFTEMTAPHTRPLLRMPQTFGSSASYMTTPVFTSFPPPSPGAAFMSPPPAFSGAPFGNMPPTPSSDGQPVFPFRYPPGVPPPG